MSRRFKPLPTLEGAQAAAVDPKVHAAVSASAGSGKTQVLTGACVAPAAEWRRSGIDPVPDVHQGRCRGNGQPHRRAPRGVGRMPAIKSPEGAVRARRGQTTVTCRRARRCSPRCWRRLAGCGSRRSTALPRRCSHPSRRGGDYAGLSADRGPSGAGTGRTTLANLLADAEENGGEQLIADVQCLSLRLGRERRGLVI